VGGKRAKERASERGRRDISGRGEQEENVCTARELLLYLLQELLRIMIPTTTTTTTNSFIAKRALKF
jgi:hypothetical protein